MSDSKPIDPGVRIGHVHLKVADIYRALGFYSGILGLHVTQRWPGAAFMAAGDYHHHIAVNTWESAGGSPPPPGATGLFHTAILYPTRAKLADALRRMMDAGIPLDGAADHGVSEALYLSDPEGNGIELYVDRPRSAWPSLQPRRACACECSPGFLPDRAAGSAHTTHPSPTRLQAC